MKALKNIELTQHEIQQATRPSIKKSKKAYTRKKKHRGAGEH